MKHIVLITADDWQGIYVNGKLMDENHSLSLRMVLEILGVEFSDFTVDQEWMENHGHLPENLSDVPEDKLS